MEELNKNNFAGKFYKVADRNYGGGLFGTLALFYKRTGRMLA